MSKHLALVALAACCAALAPAPRLGAEEPPVVAVPDVRNARLDVARAALDEAGMRVGQVWRVHWAVALEHLRYRAAVGAVIVQRPAAGLPRPVGTKVDLVVTGEESDPLPEALRVRLGLPKEEPAAADDPESPPSGPSSAGAVEGGGAEREPRPAPGPDAPPTPPLSGDDVAPSAPEPHDDLPLPDAGPTAVGSPEAPRPAPPPNRSVVPPLLGLDLAVAEQLARDADMTLYVDRVPGHPIGRVLRQDPEPYFARPAAGVVRVTITAGGDFEGEAPPSPAVHVDEAVVPELLDRTGPQAERILADLRLRGEVRVGERGLPGRVVEQRPLPRTRVPVGSVVELWVGPGEAPRATGSSAPPAPALPPEPPAEVGVPEADAAPRPVAPAAGARMPGLASFDVGFTWLAVPSATAYLLELEESDIEGNWIGLLKQRATKTAHVVTVERLDPAKPGRLRWRVAALVGGRLGKTSAWTVLD